MNRTIFIIILTLLPCCFSNLMAQGTLHGRILSSEGGGVEYATVGVVDSRTPHGATADDRGYYSLTVRETDSVTELACNLDDICEAARWLLRFGGRFVICQRPERLTDVLSSLRAHELEPKRLRLVQGRADKAPKLFLCEAKRGAKPGYMDVLPSLIIEDKNGFTEEMKQIYGAYKEGHDG